MKFITKVLGVAALVGLGYCIAKKMMEKNEKSDESYAEGCSCSSGENDKLRRASMFAVGAIKTGADKVAEGVRDIMKNDMVKKGEETIEQAKETKESIKKEIEDLKNMVISVDVATGEDAKEEENNMSSSGESGDETTFSL